MQTSLEILSQSRCFGGMQYVYQHVSMYCNTKMKFVVFLPKQSQQRKVPVLWFLSGVATNAEEAASNIQLQKYASEHGIAVIYPDTSPRNTYTSGENSKKYVGLGAGFYLDAICSPWSKSYCMYSYLLDEMQSVVLRNFPVDRKKQAITGHAMGGHGALTIGLKHPDIFCSISAFSPFCAPSKSGIAQQAFNAYLGTDKTMWDDYDATALILNGKKSNEILIDQGSEDKFLATELKPDLFAIACDTKNQSLTFRIQQGYDDSYCFINSFLEDHVTFHSKAFKKIESNANKQDIMTLSEEISMTMDNNTEEVIEALEAIEGHCFDDLSKEIRTLENALLAKKAKNATKNKYTLK